MKVVKTELTEAHKRALAELLGECWHEWTEEMRHNCCRYCSKPISREMLIRRTFDNWQDYGKCIEAITEQGNLIEFLNWFYKRWKGVFADTIHAWESMSPAARCREIADWWQERGKG